MVRILDCLPLAILGRIIGWLGMVVSVVSVVIFTVTLRRLEGVTRVMVEHSRNPKEDPVHMHRVLLIIVIIYLLLSIMNLLTSLLLLVGISKDRPVLLLPWLTNSGIALLISIIYFFYFATTTLLSMGGVPLPLKTGAISLLVQLLVWLCTYALYRRMKGTNERQRISSSSNAPKKAYGNL